MQASARSRVRESADTTTLLQVGHGGEDRHLQFGSHLARWVPGFDENQTDSSGKGSNVIELRREA